MLVALSLAVIVLGGFTYVARKIKPGLWLMGLIGSSLILCFPWSANMVVALLGAATMTWAAWRTDPASDAVVSEPKAARQPSDRE